MNKEDKILHENFQEYGQNAREWMRKCVLLLPEIQQKEIWRKKGFSSIYEYAAKLAGMNHNQVNDALRILGKIKDKPELIKVVKRKGINSVRPVACIATKETEKFWAEKAKKMSKNTLGTYVKDYRNQFGTGPGLRGTSGSRKQNKVEVSMKISPEIAKKLQKLKGNKNWDELMDEFIKLKESQLEKEKPETVKSNSRKAPKRIEKFIKARSNNACEHTNCSKKAKEIHHTEPFALKRTHNPDKMVHLCKEHHQLIHLGYLEEQHWRQIDALPYYDIMNLINGRIAEFRR
ncbi:hypothetical protein GF354_03410 [Candidatus Peregrinibacteria bacterium]|nr:hypothetical protein [Candidatus Peregrinibacteria bacterium]